MASTTTETIQPEKSPISESENIITRKIGEIILDPKINTREVDSEILGEYKDVINSYHREVVQGNGTSWQDHWNELPRITKSNHLWSGFHTVTAAREVFSVGGEIRCIVEGENYRDAYFLATRTNAQHGRRRTNAEKQTSVDRWLNDEETNLWTDSYIAKQCHVTHVFVGKRRLATISSQPTKRKFINAKGDIEWMHTTRIGKTQPPPDPPSPPPASDAKQLGGLRSVLERMYREGIPKNIVKDGKLTNTYETIEFERAFDDPQYAIDLANLYETTTEKVLALRDEILADSEQAKEEEGPDLQGLKDAVYDLLDKGSQIYAPELAETYSVMIDQTESIIAQAKADFEMETAEKHKEALMNEYDDLSSEVQHLWGKHLKRFITWDGLFASAQGNWIALKDSHDYSPADESEESLKLQNAIWTNFKADLEYAVSVINNEPAERGQIWLLKLLAIKPEPTPLAAVLTDEEAKAQADASGATDMMLAGYIDDCKTSVENLLATEQVPLVLKYAAEAFSKTIGKYLLHEKEEA